MLERIKMSFSRLTVKIALGAVVAAFISKYLPWLTDKTHSQSLAQAIAAKPDYFTGVPTLLMVGLLWVAVWFLLNHPKLTLLGDAPLLLVWLGMLMTASDYSLDLGIGAFLFILAVAVCVVMAFMTKKLKKDAGAPQAGR